MKPFLAQFIALLYLLAPQALGDESIDRLQESYLTRLDVLDTDLDLKQQKLSSSYIAALERLKPELQKSGKIAHVLPVIKEIEAVSGFADTLPGLPPDADPELIKLREKYAAACIQAKLLHAREVAALTAKMENALEAKETEFTRAGRIDAALAAKNLRETTTKDPEVVAARERVAAEAAGRVPSDSRSLLREKSTVVSEGHRRIAVLSDVTPEHNPLAPFVTALNELREKPENILMVIPHAVVDYALEKHATSIRGKITLLNAAGSVRFLIYADGKEVFARTMRGEVKEESFEANFPATRKIRLEVDPIDNGDQDWAAWLNPEIR